MAEASEARRWLCRCLLSTNQRVTSEDGSYPAAPECTQARSTNPTGPAASRQNEPQTPASRAWLLRRVVWSSLPGRAPTPATGNLVTHASLSHPHFLTDTQSFLECLESTFFRHLLLRWAKDRGVAIKVYPHRQTLPRGTCLCCWEEGHWHEDDISVTPRQLPLLQFLPSSPLLVPDLCPLPARDIQGTCCSWAWGLSDGAAGTVFPQVPLWVTHSRIA